MLIMCCDFTPLAHGPVADPEFSKGGFQDSARRARGEKLVQSRPLPVQTGGRNEELKMISVFL